MWSFPQAQQGGYYPQPPPPPQQPGYGGYPPQQPDHGFGSYAPQYAAPPPPGGPPPGHHPIAQNFGSGPPVQYAQQSTYGAQGYGPPAGPPVGGFGAPPAPSYGGGGFGGPAPPMDFPYYLGTQIGWPPNQLPPGLPGYDPSVDLNALLAATQRIGTHESQVTSIFANRTALQLAVLGHAYRARKGKSLEDMLHSELSGYYRMGILALAQGPLFFDAALVHEACRGAGTDEAVLTEVLLGRTPQEMQLLKDAYRSRYGRRIEDIVRDDLSAKTARMFVIAFEMRMEPWGPHDVQRVEQDARTLNESMRTGRTDELAVCAIVLNRSQPYLRALCDSFRNQTRGTTLTKAIKKHFSGHMEKALLYVVEGGKRDGTGAWRDAKRLEAAMRGIGTKDHQLVRRIVRMRWSPQHTMAVKAAYRAKYGKDLRNRVSGETSGDYKNLMLALVG